jgi:hypothetical protein
MWKKISTGVENWGNLLIIGDKGAVLLTDFISAGFAFPLLGNEYFQGNCGCGKLGTSDFHNWRIPHLTIPRVSGSLDNRGG